MSSPLIKIYLLDPGYTEDADTDVQQQTADELLPVIDKSQLLIDAMPLTGIVYNQNVALTPVVIASGRQTYSLAPPSGTIQLPVGQSMSNLVVNASGYLGPYVVNASGYQIDRTTYDVKNDGVHFYSTPPSGATLSAYLRANTPATHWALFGSTPYSGPNEMFNKIYVSVDNGPWQIISVWSLLGNNSYFDTSSASGVKCTMAYTSTYTTQYIGDFWNWVDDHINMRPDVFVGTIDYPGDSSVVNGIPFEPGVEPLFVPRANYSLNARMGMVTFTTPVNSLTTPVKANYAYLWGISNVTGQVLDALPSGNNLQYKAISDTLFPHASGKRWVNRNTIELPLNLYVNGIQTPQVATVVPYETLTVKLS